MNNRILPLALAAFLVVVARAGSAAAQPPTEQDGIKLKATLVSVPVIVSDRNGRYLSGLRAEDFTLYSDHVKQPIAVFEATEEPLNVALLLDTSLSTRDVLGDIKDAALSFIKRLRPQDRAVIVSFDYDVHLLSPLTADRRALEQAVKRAEIGAYAGTVLRDAVIKAANDSLRHVEGRKAIVLLTDGKDHGSAVSEVESLEAAQESGAMIYTIFYRTGFAPRFDNRRGGFGRGGFGRRGGIFGDSLPRRGPNNERRERRRERAERNNEQAADYLGQLADASAGRFYSGEVTDLKKTFDLIADELRHQYRLGFYPSGEPAGAAVHRLTVQVAHPDAVVRARRTYHATPSQ
ncbi:MAG TPA: VWA domain-containing protein [Blastocatellia bacterium]|nr:VWA domain-containing protein [Blastocatellia bacterium]